MAEDGIWTAIGAPDTDINGDHLDDYTSVRFRIGIRDMDGHDYIADTLLELVEP